VILEFNAECSLPHQEELVFIFMVVPRELALYLDDFDLLTVQGRDYFRPPVLTEQTKFFVQVNLNRHGQYPLQAGNESSAVLLLFSTVFGEAGNQAMSLFHACTQVLRPLSGTWLFPLTHAKSRALMPAKCNSRMLARLFCGLLRLKFG
jgi:hypothetical protein